jgi:hypothetical protein
MSAPDVENSISVQRDHKTVLTALDENSSEIPNEWLTTVNNLYQKTGIFAKPCAAREFPLEVRTTTNRPNE